VLQYEPCSPQCANRLRYGIQPKKARPKLRPGCCRAEAHQPTHLGYGGRRVLVSRKWTAKDLADHRHDRRAHVLAVLGRESDGAAAHSSATPSKPDTAAQAPVVWELAKQTDADVDPLSRRLLRSIARATRWRAEYRAARDGFDPPADSATPPRTLLPERTVMTANDPLLTIAQAAELLGTGPRFPRRPVAERRVRFVHVGRHVCIPESALIEFVVANTVEPLPARRRRGMAA
jgi:excisionase family DNA binding protein